VSAWKRVDDLEREREELDGALVDVESLKAEHPEVIGPSDAPLRRDHGSRRGHQVESTTMVALTSTAPSMSSTKTTSTSTSTLTRTASNRSAT